MLCYYYRQQKWTFFWQIPLKILFFYLLAKNSFQVLTFSVDTSLLCRVSVARWVGYANSYFQDQTVCTKIKNYYSSLISFTLSPPPQTYTHPADFGISGLGLGTEELHHCLPLSALLATHAGPLLQPEFRSGHLERGGGSSSLNNLRFSK